MADTTTPVHNKLIEIQNELNTALADAGKFDKGTKAAGPRVRKTMQAIAKLTKETRDLVTQITNANKK